MMIKDVNYDGAIELINAISVYGTKNRNYFIVTSFGLHCLNYKQICTLLKVLNNERDFQYDLGDRITMPTLRLNNIVFELKDYGITDRDIVINY